MEAGTDLSFFVYVSKLLCVIYPVMLKKIINTIETMKIVESGSIEDIKFYAIVSKLFVQIIKITFNRFCNNGL